MYEVNATLLSPPLRNNGKGELLRAEFLEDLFYSNWLITLGTLRARARF